MTTETGPSQPTPSTGERTGPPQVAKRSSSDASDLDSTPRSGELVAAVKRDIAKLPDDVANGGYAALAVALARELDNPNSATSKSMCGRALLDTLNRLTELTPVKTGETQLDELARRRTERLARESAAAH
jgi:hypothetical protein